MTGDERVRRLVTALERHLREALGLALGPLPSCDPRQIFAALAAEEDPSPWIFGVRSRRPPRPSEVEAARHQAISALFLLYHALLADSL